MSVKLYRELLEPAGFQAALVQDKLPLDEQHRRPGDPLESVRERGTALVSWRIDVAPGGEERLGGGSARMAMATPAIDVFGVSFEQQLHRH